MQRAPTATSTGSDLADSGHPEVVHPCGCVLSLFLLRLPVLPPALKRCLHGQTSRRRVAVHRSSANHTKCAAHRKLSGCQHAIWRSPATAGQSAFLDSGTESSWRRDTVHVRLLDGGEQRSACRRVRVPLCDAARSPVRSGRQALIIPALLPIENSPADPRWSIPLSGRKPSLNLHHVRGLSPRSGRDAGGTVSESRSTLPKTRPPSLPGQGRPHGPALRSPLAGAPRVRCERPLWITPCTFRNGLDIRDSVRKGSTCLRTPSLVT